MYYRFGKTIYFISVLLFIFVLLYFYSALPEKIAYSIDRLGDESSAMEKGNFFYLMILMFVFCNALVLLPPKLLETKSHLGLRKVFPVGDTYRDYFLAWFYSFGAILNMSLGLMVFYIHSLNNQNEIASEEFNIFFYVVPIFFLIWIVGLFLILIGKFKQVQTKS
jgi:hypothetical protein